MWPLFSLCGHIHIHCTRRYRINLPTVKDHLLYVTTFAWLKGCPHTASFTVQELKKLNKNIIRLPNNVFI